MLKLKSSGQDINLPRDLPMPKYEYQTAVTESFSYTPAESGKRPDLGTDGVPVLAVPLRNSLLKI